MPHEEQQPLEERIAELELAVAEHEGRHHTVAQALSDLRNRTETLAVFEERIDVLGKRLDALPALDEVDAAADDVETRLCRLERIAEETSPTTWEANK